MDLFQLFRKVRLILFFFCLRRINNLEELSLFVTSVGIGGTKVNWTPRRPPKPTEPYPENSRHPGWSRISFVLYFLNLHPTEKSILDWGAQSMSHHKRKNEWTHWDQDMASTSFNLLDSFIHHWYMIWRHWWSVLLYWFLEVFPFNLWNKILCWPNLTSWGVLAGVFRTNWMMNSTFFLPSNTEH